MPESERILKPIHLVTHILASCCSSNFMVITNQQKLHLIDKFNSRRDDLMIINTCNKAIFTPAVRKVKKQFGCCTGSVVEPFQCCAPQALRSSHSLKMHEQLHRLGLETSQGYTGAIRCLFLPFLCLPTRQQPEHFSCDIDTLNLDQQMPQTPKATVTHPQKPFSA